MDICALVCRIIIVFLFSFSGIAWCELVIKVTKGNDSPTKIAIAPIVNVGNPARFDISRLVENDLQRSGLFVATPRADMLSFPSMVKDVYFRDWRLLGTDYLVIGKMSSKETDKIEIEFSLLSIASQKVIFRHKVSGSDTQLRDLGHLISDKVYNAITGIRGIFSTRVAYITAIREVDGVIYRLHVSDVDGAREKLMLRSHEPIMSPSWSPDAKKLAYVSFETGRPAIYTQNLATAVREQITNFAGLNGAPAWSPDGTTLALVLSKDGNPEIYLMDLQSKQLNRLTQHFSIDTEPAWMPDGKNLLFTSDRGGEPQIYKLNIATKAIERLTFEGNYNARGSLAPDGRTLAMVHRKTGAFHIAAFDLQTRRIRELTTTSLDESPSVAPNGAMLMYAMKQEERGMLAAVSLDAGVRYILPARSGDVREPAWSPFIR